MVEEESSPTENEKSAHATASSYDGPNMVAEIAPFAYAPSPSWVIPSDLYSRLPGQASFYWRVYAFISFRHEPC